MKVKWRIYYDDSTTFDNLNGDPWKAPGRGIIVILQPDPSPMMQNVNTQRLRGHPFYWYHRIWGYWLHSDRDGLLDQLTNDRENVVCAVKMGRWADFSEDNPNGYYAIIDRANNDPDFPKKSGEHKAERRYSD